MLVANPSIVVPDPTFSDLFTVKSAHLVRDFSFDSILLLLSATVRFAFPVAYGIPEIMTCLSPESTLTIVLKSLMTTLPTSKT